MKDRLLQKHESYKTTKDQEMAQFSQQYQQMQEEFILLDQAYLQQQKQSKAFI